MSNQQKVRNVSETKRPTIATRFSDQTGIFFRFFDPCNSASFWQHVDMNDGRGAQVGPHYPTKEQLLADNESYLRRAGWLVDDRSQNAPAHQIRMGWHEGVSASNVTFVGLYLTTQAAIDADEGPDAGDFAQVEDSGVSDLFDRVCVAVNERNPQSEGEAIQFAISTLSEQPVDAIVLHLRKQLGAALTQRKLVGVTPRLDEVREWVRVHYKHDFDAQSAEKQLEWVDLYVGRHSIGLEDEEIKRMKCSLQGALVSEEDSTALKARFKDHFATNGLDSALPADIETTKTQHPVEWDEACREFVEYGWPLSSEPCKAAVISEVPNEGEIQFFRYDDQTESGFIIRNEGDGRFKAEDWRDGDIVENAYGTYEQMKAWTEAEAARKELPLLLDLTPTGVEPVFHRSLAGYAGQAAAKELIENWDEALRCDTNGNIVGNLIGDVDEVIEALLVFRARASAVLPERYQTSAKQPTRRLLAELSDLTEAGVFEVARRHGIQNYLVHDRQLIAFLETLLGRSIAKSAAPSAAPVLTLCAPAVGT